MSSGMDKLLSEKAFNMPKVIILLKENIAVGFSSACQLIIFFADRYPFSSLKSFPIISSLSKFSLLEIMASLYAFNRLSFWDVSSSPWTAIIFLCPKSIRCFTAL
ncbi:hypothetical protein D3C72_2111610 [compost metagenome]